MAWVKTFPTIIRFTYAADEVSGHGEVAYARGTYGLDMIVPDGASPSDRGAFLQIHQRPADGTWPYTHIMFQSTEAYRQRQRRGRHERRPEAGL